MSPTNILAQPPLPPTLSSDFRYSFCSTSPRYSSSSSLCSLTLPSGSGTSTTMIGKSRLSHISEEQRGQLSGMAYVRSIGLSFHRWSRICRGEQGWHPRILGNGHTWVGPSLLRLIGRFPFARESRPANC